MDRIVDSFNAASAWLPWTGTKTGLAYEPAVTASSTIEISEQKYHAMWDEWQTLPCVQWFESRTIAVERLKSCLANQSDTLDLRSLSLTTLPELPLHIKTLEVGFNRLVALPVLPESLTTFSAQHNQLTCLPRLPESIIELKISNNKLDALPALPENLVSLYADNNQLTALPRLPPDLTRIHVNNNNLTELPSLPELLEALWIERNSLTQLPKLPYGLQLIIANKNRLTTLPDIPNTMECIMANDNLLTMFPSPLSKAMKELYLKNNKLLRLPENIFSFKPYPFAIFFSRVHIDVSHNPLLPKTITSLNMNKNTGPKILFTEGGHDEMATSMLSNVVTDWFPEEKKQTIYDQWRVIENSESDYVFKAFGLFGVASAFYAFRDFLLCLRKTISERDAPGFIPFVASWLDTLLATPTLRINTFDIAKEAAKNAEINIAQTWYDMQKAAVLDVFEKNEGDDALFTLITMARENFRFEQLEAMAREKASKLLFFTELEVYMALQSQLRAELNLTSIPQNLYSSVPPDMTTSELESIASRIKKEENIHFLNWLAQWIPWQRYVERIQPEAWAMMMEKRQQRIEHDHPIRLRNRLKKLGLNTDDVAAHAIGLDITQEINQKCHVELTRNVFKGAKKQSLLSPYWNNHSWWNPWR